MKSSAHFSPSMSDPALGDVNVPAHAGEAVRINRASVDFMCCRNRTLDLAKGRYQKHKREMLSSPRWLPFLVRFFHLAHYFAGPSLTFG